MYIKFILKVNTTFVYSKMSPWGNIIKRQWILWAWHSC